MTAAPRTAQDYFGAALEVLGDQGSEALTIAVLCERLDITKGSFYHHFGSMADFVHNLLRYWQDAHNDQLIAAARRQSDPGLRLLTLTEFAVSLPHAPEAAIRAWAHSNASVAAAVATVDERRDAIVVEAIVGMGVPPARAEVFARLALTLLIGIQNREHAPDPFATRVLFDEIIKIALAEADPAKLDDVLAALSATSGVPAGVPAGAPVGVVPSA